jgi:hypothetical protein
MGRYLVHSLHSMAHSVCTACVIFVMADTVYLLTIVTTWESLIKRSSGSMAIDVLDESVPGCKTASPLL